MEVEKIILSKKYFELTPKELEQVSVLVSSESDFDDMKAFLLATQTTFQSQKIESTPELDSKVLSHLNASASTQQSWYNSFLLFLFPRDRRVYQYPAFQLGLATVLVFVVFNVMNFDSLKENSMAFEDVGTIVEEKSVQPAEVETVLEELEEKTDVTSDNLVPGYEVPLPNKYDLKTKELNDEMLMEDVAVNSADMIMADEEIYFEQVEVEEGVNIDRVVDLDQTVKTGSNKDENSDFKTTNSISVINNEVEKNQIEEEIASPAVVNTSTVATESRTDNRFNYKKDKMNAKTEAENKIVSGYVDDVTSESDKEEIQSAREASLNSTPELKQLFFEVK